MKNITIFKLAAEFYASYHDNGEQNNHEEMLLEYRELPPGHKYRYERAVAHVMKLIGVDDVGVNSTKSSNPRFNTAQKQRPT